MTKIKIIGKTMTHPLNNNLAIYQGTHFNGVPLLPNKQYITQYLQGIEQVIANAVSKHPRTLAIRFDLHLPEWPNCPDYPNPYDSTVISSFFASLKAKFKADIQRKLRNNTRVHLSTLRYVWVKEQSQTNKPHYHVVIFLNNDTYNAIGRYTEKGCNNASRIIEAWASALKFEFNEARPLVHFPSDTPMYFLNLNSPDYLVVYFQLFKRLSYLAKLDTKQFGYGSVFGCSNK